MEGRKSEVQRIVKLCQFGLRKYWVPWLEFILSWNRYATGQWPCALSQARRHDNPAYDDAVGRQGDKKNPDQNFGDSKGRANHAECLGVEFLSEEAGGGAKSAEGKGQAPPPQAEWNPRHNPHIN